MPTTQRKYNMDSLFENAGYAIPDKIIIITIYGITIISYIYISRDTQNN